MANTKSIYKLAVEFENKLTKQASGFKVPVTDALDSLIADTVNEVKADPDNARKYISEAILDAYRIGARKHPASESLFYPEDKS